MISPAVFANYPKAGPSSRDPRMTSMFRRGTIFATFFLSLLGGGLVCAALVTQHWVDARPWRTPNPQESAGKVHFGLLQGKKELNVAYGWRTYHISGIYIYTVSYFPPFSLWKLSNCELLHNCMIISLLRRRNLEWYAVRLIRTHSDRNIDMQDITVTLRLQPLHRACNNVTRCSTIRDLKMNVGNLHASKGSS